MQKGEFPTSLMGSELALHTPHRKQNPLQGVKRHLPRAGERSPSLTAPEEWL